MTQINRGPLCDLLGVARPGLDKAGQPPEAILGGPLSVVDSPAMLPSRALMSEAGANPDLPPP